MEGTIGEIRLFAANFAPYNWAFCDGQILQLRQYTALFSILGTTYGGDGKTTFALPNLAGRSAVAAGQGSGLSSYSAGDTAGNNSVALSVSNLAAHTHTATGSFVIPAYSEEGDSGTPANNVLAAKASMYNSKQESDSTTLPDITSIQVQTTGLGTPMGITQPSLGMNYIICLIGDFPVRS